MNKLFCDNYNEAKKHEDSLIHLKIKGARCVIAAIIENWCNDPSSNLRLGSLHLALIHLGKVCILQFKYNCAASNHMKISFRNALTKGKIAGICVTSAKRCKSKVDDRRRGWPEGYLYNSYYTERLRRALLLSLGCSTLLLIGTLYCWVLNKEVSSTI